MKTEIIIISDTNIIKFLVIKLLLNIHIYMNWINALTFKL